MLAKMDLTKLSLFGQHFLLWTHRYYQITFKKRNIDLKVKDSNGLTPSMNACNIG